MFFFKFTLKFRIIVKNSLNEQQHQHVIKRDKNNKNYMLMATK